MELVISIVSFILFIYGVILGFRAHILMGIALILLAPIAVVFAILSFFGINASQLIVDKLQQGSQPPPAQT